MIVRRLHASFPRALIVIVVASWISACSHVEIVRDDGTKEVRWQFGVVMTEETTAAPARMVHITSVGLTAAYNDFVLGYFDADYAFLDESCRLVIWAENESQVTALIGEFEKVCVFQQK